MAAPAASNALDRVSVSSAGAANNGDSFGGSISDDGDTIVFSSASSALVPGDGNGKNDIFVYKVSSDTLTLISRSTTGVPANDNSGAPSISGDGRYVVFESGATDLVENFVDGNGTSQFDDVPDIFVHDLNDGTTSLVSLSNTDSPSLQSCKAPTINTTGQFVAFQAGAGLANDTEFDFPRQIYVRDLTNGTTTLVSVDTNGTAGSAESHRPDISADGTLIVFDTQSDLLDGGDTNEKNMAPVTDVYLREVANATTTLISLGNADQQGDDISWKANISGNGDLVAFTSEATNFEPSGAIADRSKVFLRDRGGAMETTTRISTSVSGGDPDANTELPSFSANGSYLVFQSGASNLLAPGIDTNGEFDIYYYDLNSMGLTRISVADSGAQGNAGSYGPNVSNDGRVVFNTRSTGFSASDNDAVNDVYATINRPGSPTTPPTGAPVDFAAKQALQAKVEKLQKKLKALKRSGKKAKAKKFAKKIKRLNKLLKAL